MSQERRVRDAADYRALARLAIKLSQPTSVPKARIRTINVSNGTVMVAGSTRWRQGQ